MESDRTRETANWDVDEIILRTELFTEEEQVLPEEPEPSIEDRYDNWMHIIDQ